MTDEAPKKRNRPAELKRAEANRNGRLIEMAAARHDQSLGDEQIKLAQALILCTLPHSPTPETKVTRRARLSDGSTLSVTFTAMTDGVGLPYGADRKLLFWLLDRAIQNNSAFVPWSSATEYQQEIELGKGGRTNKQMKERFERIAGLAISIKRKGDGAAEATTNFLIVKGAYLPKSISRSKPEAQAKLPALGEFYGLQLHEPFFEDIKKHSVFMPRRMWRDIRGSAHIQDLVFWLYYRCSSAQTESRISWAALMEQFPQSDSNPRRIRQYFTEAVKVLQSIWRDVELSIEPGFGIRVDRPSRLMLDDDPSRGRQRRL